MHKLRILYKKKVFQTNDNYPFSNNRCFFVNKFEYMSGGGHEQGDAGLEACAEGRWGLIPVADLREREGCAPPGAQF